MQPANECTQGRSLNARASSPETPKQRILFALLYGEGRYSSNPAMAKSLRLTPSLVSSGAHEERRGRRLPTDDRT